MKMNLGITGCENEVFSLAARERVNTQPGCFKKGDDA
jgi:hypothetical protein